MTENILRRLKRITIEESLVLEIIQQVVSGVIEAGKNYERLLNSRKNIELDSQAVVDAKLKYLYTGVTSSES
jgi:hypothetical protein